LKHKRQDSTISGYDTDTYSDYPDLSMNVTEYHCIRLGKLHDYDQHKPILLKLIIPSYRSMIKINDNKKSGTSKVLNNIHTGLHKRIVNINSQELKKFESLLKIKNAKKRRMKHAKYYDPKYDQFKLC